MGLSSSFAAKTVPPSHIQRGLDVGNLLRKRSVTVSVRRIIHVHPTGAKYLGMAPYLLASSVSPREWSLVHNHPTPKVTQKSTATPSPSGCKGYDVPTLGQRLFPWFAPF
ncbi:hypothetical protein ETB97_010304 [Aspergillus alliaceus]|uniref:Uncharacterized protein n=1 Tax=Petromyces alliaceus TaxID=209559 RepID=A0A8H6A7M3_PETAA|nr:hypothetical protein ETB97_010304 [Aspergillus burnettii]